MAGGAITAPLPRRYQTPKGLAPTRIERRRHAVRRFDNSGPRFCDRLGCRAARGVMRNERHVADAAPVVFELYQVSPRGAAPRRRWTGPFERWMPPVRGVISSPLEPVTSHRPLGSGAGRHVGGGNNSGELRCTVATFRRRNRRGATRGSADPAVCESVPHWRGRSPRVASV